MSFTDLLQSTPEVLNVGVTDFAEALRAQGVDVVQMGWKPPRKMNAEIERLLDRLL
ncbi:MAG TPA: hypothetical protein VEV82_05660 [Actinomycetota bacterium]|nr:hypothetical protein [Actinomycetota bacterium]